MTTLCARCQVAQSFMLNLSSVVDVMNAAYSLPDDYEREMMWLADEVRRRTRHAL